MNETTQESGSKKITPIVSAGILIIAVLALGWLVIKGKNPQSQNSGNNQVSTTSPSVNSASVLQSIQFNPTPVPVIRTSSLPADQGTVQYFTIGVFTDGEYKDKTLNIALYEYPNQAPSDPISVYAYYIGDSAGAPVAWDKNFVYGYAISYNQNTQSPVTPEMVFDLPANLERYISAFPKEFSETTEIKASDHIATFMTTTGLFSSNALLYSAMKAGETEDGLPIMKEALPNQVYPSLLAQESYYVQLPFGRMILILPEPNFMDANDVPELTWSVGTSTVASYRYGQYAYGWEDCFVSISETELRASFVKTGQTASGDPVYEANPAQYPQVYTCLHDKTKRYVYDEVTQIGTNVDTISYADFIQTHPLFFWQHPYGDLVAFVRSDVVPSAEKAKPVIYLYPTKPEGVSVTVAPVGGFTKTIPEYGNGWNVNAAPDGVITNLTDGKQYPYLFWEGGKDGAVEIPKEGFVIAKDDMQTELGGKLTQLGLNKQERTDFLEFWTPKLSESPYYFITFVSRSEIDRVAPLTISPKPDTTLRVLMYYKPLTQPENVTPLTITSTPRKGFTVVEWGGILQK